MTVFHVYLTKNKKFLRAKKRTMTKEEPNLKIQIALLLITACLPSLTLMGVREGNTKTLIIRTIRTMMIITHLDPNRTTRMQKAEALNIVASPTDWHPPSSPVGLLKARKGKAQSN